MTSTKSDEIRSEIEATRERLGHDLDELQDRLSPHKVAGRTAQGVKSKVVGAGSAAGHALGPGRDKAAALASTGGAKAAALATAGRDAARANPRAAGSVAGSLAALGLFGTLVRRQRRHRDC